MEAEIRFLRYDSYKNSGADWLGEIPAHWNIKKTKFLWREQEQRSLDGKEQLLSVSQYYGVVPKKDDSRSESLVDYKKCGKQDLVVNIMLAWLGGLGVTDHDGIVSPAYCVYRQSENNNAHYLNYLYRTSVYLAEFARRSKGVVPSRWRMYTEDFGQILTLLPPRNEQNRIANFLDQKTAEIDKAVAKKQRLIELLKEQKVILINQAVTRGLNPDAPMRDSGVEWIGEIPEHWEITRLKFATEFIVDCLHATPKYAENGTFPAIRTADITAGLVHIDNARKVKPTTYQRWIERAKPIENDILYSREGERYGIAAPVPKNTNLCISQRMMHFRASGELNPIYLMWQLNCQHVYLQAFFDVTGATSPHVNISTIRNYWIVVPPLDEQNTVVSHIEKWCKPTHEAMDKIENEISLLYEYRNSMISNAVIGKIKI